MGAVIALVAVSAYAGSIAPTVTRDDPAELQVIGWAAGLPHGTSYPLYIWLVRFLLLFHVGANVAQRVTMVSVLSSGGALFVLYLLAARMVGERGLARWVAAAAATGLFAYSYTLWSVSIIAGMYSLHVLLAALALQQLVRWDQTRDDRRLYTAAIVLGASMGNHVMTIALLPGAVALVVLGVWDRRPVKDTLILLARVGGASLAAVAFFNVALFYLLWARHVPFDHWAGITAAPTFFESRPARPTRSGTRGGTRSRAGSSASSSSARRPRRSTTSSNRSRTASWPRSSRSARLPRWRAGSCSGGAGGAST